RGAEEAGRWCWHVKARSASRTDHGQEHPGVAPRWRRSDARGCPQGPRVRPLNHFCLTHVIQSCHIKSATALAVIQVSRYGPRAIPGEHMTIMEIFRWDLLSRPSMVCSKSDTTTLRS